MSENGAGGTWEPSGQQPVWPQRTSPAPAVPSSPMAVPAAQAPAPQQAPPSAHRPPRRGRRALRVLVRTVTVLLLLALAALSAYLWITLGAWERQNDQLRDQALELGQQVAEAQAQQQALQGELDATTAQLDEAKERVTDIVNQDARAGDSVHVLENVIDGLMECARERQRHIEVLSDPTREYVSATNSQVEADITRYCTSVINNWEEYQERER